MPAASRWGRWLAATCDREPLVLFRIIFGATWLVYDLIDLFGKQMQVYVWFYRVPFNFHLLAGLQALLVALECALVLGWRPRLMAFGIFLARAGEVYLVPLNDFVAVGVAALILSQMDCQSKRRADGSLEPAQAWPREVFVLQIAWIYLATAILKMSPLFLSGGELYVRQNYTAALLPLPYPRFYLNLISNLRVDALLSRMAVTLELTLGLSLVAWTFWPRQRARLRLLAIALVLAIHGFAAVAVNVFFFGFTMIVEVVLMTREKQREPGAGPC